MSFRIAAKILFILAACTAGVAMAHYLAAGFYFFANQVMPETLAWDTWWRYWRAYGNDPVQRPRLLGSGIAAILMIGAGTIALLANVANKSRPLHGDARWATEAEIRKAGLL